MLLNLKRGYSCWPGKKFYEMLGVGQFESKDIWQQFLSTFFEFFFSLKNSTNQNVWFELLKTPLKSHQYINKCQRPSETLLRHLAPWAGYLYTGTLETPKRRYSLTSHDRSHWACPNWKLPCSTERGHDDGRTRALITRRKKVESCVGLSWQLWHVVFASSLASTRPSPRQPLATALQSKLWWYQLSPPQPRKFKG